MKCATQILRNSHGDNEVWDTFVLPCLNFYNGVCTPDIFPLPVT